MLKSVFSCMCFLGVALAVFPGAVWAADTAEGYAATPSGYRLPAASPSSTASAGRRGASPQSGDYSAPVAVTPSGYVATPSGYTTSSTGARSLSPYRPSTAAYVGRQGGYAATSSGYATTPSGAMRSYPRAGVAAPRPTETPPRQPPPVLSDVPTPHDPAGAAKKNKFEGFAFDGGDGQPESVFDIIVVGNQRIEAATILSYMDIAIGDSITQSRLNQALKTLYGTGLFSDVNLVRDGDTLVVQVSENPIINRLVFEGNEDISDETLESETQLRPRVVYTRSKVQNDTKRILELYRRSGRFAAKVDPQIVELPENRVNLVFEIIEGGVTRVERINFIGNQRFSDSTLQGVTLTKEKRWYRFFSSDDTYDPDRLTFDRELLRRYYLKNGYADFRVVSAVAELAPTKDSFIITFTLDEGERYHVGTVEVTSRISELKDKNLIAEVVSESGDWYDAEDIEETINNLTDYAGKFGYAFVDVRTKAKRDSENHAIDINYIVNEGPRVYVDKINIFGNKRTLDKVIRREFKLVEGDAFNTAKLRRSQQLVRNLGIFERVEVTNAPGSSPDRTVINVEVAERATGELSVGAGFSSADGPIGNTSIRERNLLGRGQNLKLAFSISGRTQQLDLSFTEPYFLDRNLAAGFDVFRITHDLQAESGYDEESVGFVMRAGYRLIGDIKQSWSYTLRRDEIQDLSATVSRFIRDRRLDTTTSSISQALTYDQRNDRTAPSDGHILQLTTDYAGLGGNVNYFRLTGAGAVYYPLAPQWVGSIAGRVGKIIG
ncbi:MAG: outer membrane protein assembly factor BamA, partial [Alphaproteobacteria bacterium]|nr:outer membrane protein assembly factor BamA [Alphaproteobacteria bacterium]